MLTVFLLKFLLIQNVMLAFVFFSSSFNSGTRKPGRSYTTTSSMPSANSARPYSPFSSPYSQGGYCAHFFHNIPHVCQLSWIIRESPRYEPNLPVSWPGCQISQIQRQILKLCCFMLILANLG